MTRRWPTVTGFGARKPWHKRRKMGMIDEICRRNCWG
jgi:hypothetical protein